MLVEGGSGSTIPSSWGMVVEGVAGVEGEGGEEVEEGEDVEESGECVEDVEGDEGVGKVGGGAGEGGFIFSIYFSQFLDASVISCNTKLQQTDTQHFSWTVAPGQER